MAPLVIPEHVLPNFSMISIGLHLYRGPCGDESTSVPFDRADISFVLHAREHRVGFESTATFAANQPFN